MNTSNTQEHTTPDGYTYKYIPAYTELTPGIIELLNEAPKYKKVKIIAISQKYWEYFKEKFRVSGNYYDATFIYKDVELNIAYYEKSNSSLIRVVLFLDGKPIKKCYKKIFRHMDISAKGLQVLLDPNYGGGINNETLDIANLIVFG